VPPPHARTRTARAPNSSADRFAPRVWNLARTSRMDGALRALAPTGIKPVTVLLFSIPPTAAAASSPPSRSTATRSPPRPVGHHQPLLGVTALPCLPLCHVDAPSCPRRRHLDEPRSSSTSRLQTRRRHPELSSKPRAPTPTPLLCLHGTAGVVKPAKAMPAPEPRRPAKPP
jgi:hypothetical protein